MHLSVKNVFLCEVWNSRNSDSILWMNLNDIKFDICLDIKEIWKDKEVRFNSMFKNEIGNVVNANLTSKIKTRLN